MECPHLSDSVKVNRDFIKQKIIELSSNHTNGTNADDIQSATAKKEKNVKLWKCLGKNKLYLGLLVMRVTNKNWSN